MPIPVSLNFVGTGKPIRVNTNPQINRNASRKGVLLTGIKSRSELNQIKKSLLDPTFEDVGRKAVTIMRSTGIDYRI